jgi:hypothetical protein
VCYRIIASRRDKKRTNTILNDAFELPPLEQIEEMDRQRSLAIEALEISDGFVKCQKCSIAVLLLRTSTKPRSNRIDALQKQIRWIEDHNHGNTKAYANNYTSKTSVPRLLK